MLNFKFSIKLSNNITILYEKKEKMKSKKGKVGISLIVIGILIVLGGIVGYYIEKANCPPGWESGCGFFTSAGGLGLLGLIFLGGVSIVIGLFLSIRAARST